MPFGSYRREHRLAAGGMGEVFYATRLGPGGFEKPVALKLLLPNLLEDPQAIQMFLDEGRLAARMDHPNIVQIFEVGEARGRYYIAMELVRGVSLAQLLRRLRANEERLSASQLAHVGRSLCDALEHAHEQVGPDGRRLELVHRDVTPHNVLVSTRGEVKLTDFGIARARNTQSSTRQGQLKGKLEYMAPEQIQGKPADRRSDVYALGVTLYEAATQISPFRRDNDGAIVGALLSAEYAPLQSLRSDLPESFVRAVTRAMSPDPAERFADAASFREALDLADAGAVTALGSRVDALCGDWLAVLEPTGSVRAPTQGMESNTATTAPSPPLQRQRSRRAVVVAAAGLLSAAGGLGLFLARPTSSPPAPLQASPEVVAAAPIQAAAESAVTPVSAALTSTPTNVSNVAVTPERAPAEPSTQSGQDPGAGTKSNVREPRRKRVRPTQRSAALAVPGYIAVDAVPWALVFVDGKKIGHTPIARFPVERAKVRVKLTNPETGRSTTKVVTVTAGERTLVKADLR